MCGKSCLRTLLLIVVSVFASSAFAGVAPIVGLTSPDDAYNLMSSAVANATTTTITVNFNSRGAPDAYEALISTLAIQGTNAADFSILPSSTCVAGTTTLDSTDTSCTVVIQYRPSTANPESAQLAITCSTTAVTGGFSLVCSPDTGSISLLGSVVAAITSTSTAPALDARMLTLLSVLMLGVGGYFAARRT